MNSKMLDYEQVRIALNETVVDPHGPPAGEPDLTFSFGPLSSPLPIMFYYASDEPDERAERACEQAGVLTCGAVGSKIPFASAALLEKLGAAGPMPSTLGEKRVNPFDRLGCFLYEALDVTAPRAIADVKGMTDYDQAVIVGCSVSVSQGRVVANELRLASALLVGPTQPSTFKDIDTLGLATPRVTFVQDLSREVSVPVFATAASSSEACKAIVAGADAVLVNIGGPFRPDDDVEFVVNAVASSLGENLKRLCRLAGAVTYKHLAFRCRVVPLT